jgi:hypothetical protein
MFLYQKVKWALPGNLNNMTNFLTLLIIQNYWVITQKFCVLYTIIWCGSVWVRNLASSIKGEYKLRVFENRMLRRIFGPKRDEVTGDWRKLHNEELHNLYS